MFLDFSKDFDKIPHSIWVHKVVGYGSDQWSFSCVCVYQKLGAGKIRSWGTCLSSSKYEKDLKHFIGQAKHELVVWCGGKEGECNLAVEQFALENGKLSITGDV